jgi:hypothetical protein
MTTLDDWLPLVAHFFESRGFCFGAEEKESFTDAVRTELEIPGCAASRSPWRQ